MTTVVLAILHRRRPMLKPAQVSDSGMANLQGLTKLSALNLFRSRVTDAGVAELQEALPGLRIEH